VLRLTHVRKAKTRDAIKRRPLELVISHRPKLTWPANLGALNTLYQ
jgi:hypothetical protein